MTPQMPHRLLAMFIVLLSFQVNAQVADTPENICPILISETLPSIEVYAKDNKAHDIRKLITQPTVLIFYRGGWCPYCTRHLSELVEIEDKIASLGYQVIAISPEDVPNIENVEAPLQQKIKVYADKHGNLIKALGIAFTPNDRTLGHMIKKSLGTVAELLPVPTVLIVDQEAKVQFSFINPDYTTRLSGKFLLSVLNGLE